MYWGSGTAVGKIMSPPGPHSHFCLACHRIGRSWCIMYADDTPLATPRPQWLFVFFLFFLGFFFGGGGVRLRKKYVGDRPHQLSDPLQCWWGYHFFVAAPPPPPPSDFSRLLRPHCHVEAVFNKQCHKTDSRLSCMRWTAPPPPPGSEGFRLYRSSFVRRVWGWKLPYPNSANRPYFGDAWLNLFWLFDTVTGGGGCCIF